MNASNGYACPCYHIRCMDRSTGMECMNTLVMGVQCTMSSCSMCVQCLYVCTVPIHMYVVCSVQYAVLMCRVCMRCTGCTWVHGLRTQCV